MRKNMTSLAQLAAMRLFGQQSNPFKKPIEFKEIIIPSTEMPPFSQEDRDKLATLSGRAKKAFVKELKEKQWRLKVTEQNT